MQIKSINCYRNLKVDNLQGDLPLVEEGCCLLTLDYFQVSSEREEGEVELVISEIKKIDIGSSDHIQNQCDVALSFALGGKNDELADYYKKYPEHVVRVIRNGGDEHSRQHFYPKKIDCNYRQFIN